MNGSHQKEMLGNNNILSIKDIRFRYSFLSTNDFPVLQEDINQLDKAGKISSNEQFRGYIEKMGFKVPDDFPDAKYVVILAREDKLALVNFYYKGQKHEVMIPPGYYSSGLKSEDIVDLIQTEIIKETGYKVVPARGLHLKLLAVRSGLARYGKNNISYVPEFGSFLALHAFYTDYDFAADTLVDKRFLDDCENCKICQKACPNKCITDENPVIDVSKCITLYNEAPGEFPDWINNKDHNGLFGCMKCQKFCPANKVVMKNPKNFEDITEDETKLLLTGGKDKTLLESISKKLHIPIAANADHYLPVIKRNLKVLID